MVGASKILTVSYGTFSCTLEGFDDSFGTMKAIAEYFRDLAADDRYFGAEPPTPDAEMLQRIAEREIRKRVEARISDHGVVLRPEPGSADAAPEPETTPAPAPAETALAPIAPAAAPVEPVVEAPTAAEGNAPVAEYPAAADESVEDIATEAAPAEAEMPASAEAEAIEDSPAPAEEIETAPATEIDEIINEAPAEIAPEIEEAAEEMAEPAPGEPAPVEDVYATEDETADEPAEEIEEPEADDLGSVAAKLARIRAVVDSARSADAAPASAAVTSDAAEQDNEAEADIEDEIAAEQVAEIAEAEMPAAPQPDLAEEIFEEDHDIYAGQEAETEEALTEDVPVEDADEADAVEAEAPIEDATPEVEPEEAPAPVMETAAPVEDDDEDADETAAATENLARKAVARARARVRKVKRADLEELRAGLQTAPEAEAEEKPQAEAPEAETAKEAALSPEDEADLMAELAEVERDAKRTAPEGREQLESSGVNGDEAAVSRLVSEVNTKLDGPEHRRRRSAIAHLKAAVAATVAERHVKPGGDDTDSARSAYQRDLDSAVRPTRPSRALGNDKMPPLMLVSEQRIDHPAETAPVRPRRVSAGNTALKHVEDEDLGAIETEAETDGNIFQPETSFADFARRAQAEELPEILEAGAAYLIRVEGHEEFTRPRLMRLITEQTGDSREDCLRSFGRLLREERIVKTSRGRFTLMEGSHYLKVKID